MLAILISWGVNLLCRVRQFEDVGVLWARSQRISSQSISEKIIEFSWLEIKDLIIDNTTTTCIQVLTSTLSLKLSNIRCSLVFVYH